MRLGLLLLGLFGSIIYQGCWDESRLLSAHAASPAKPHAVSGESVQLAYRKVGGVPVRYVIADLNNPNVRVGVVTARRLGSDESIWDLLARSRPTAAVTGTYFSTTNKLPVGDIVIEGERVHFGGVGTALCITYDNQVRFIRQRLHRQRDWSQYRLVLGAGPRLLLNGQVALYPPGEGFRDKRVYARGKRVAVGVTKHNKLLLAVVEQPISLRRLAWVMRGLGATDAIALDGGGSCFLYYRRMVKVFPKRKLTNLLVVYEDSAEYDARVPRLKPQNRYARR
ncbi:MAG: phosphodiester glycosidase family protein [Fimbriimonadales bacterium]|nr:phosphodiester glycosidase family protein [Fimbriimonadales bacterium]